MTKNQKERRPTGRTERAAWYASVLEAQASSGPSMTEFAAKIGVTAVTLYHWERQLSTNAESPSEPSTIPPSGLIRVALNDCAAAEAPSMFIIRPSSERSIEAPQDFDAKALEQRLGTLEACRPSAVTEPSSSPGPPIDIRKSFCGLAGIVRDKLDSDPVSPDLFLLCNRSRNRLKVLVYDEAGVWLLAKRLDHCTFAWPAADSWDVKVQYGEAYLTLLLRGLPRCRIVAASPHQPATPRHTSRRRITLAPGLECYLCTRAHHRAAAWRNYFLSAGTSVRPPIATRQVRTRLSTTSPSGTSSTPYV